MEYSTLSARLASFPITSKRSKSGWPHKSPSIDDIANAGFYYKPQGAGSDNVVCYLCERALDGWESEDNPIQEHLRHSPECGWAVMMSQAQAEKHHTDEMEDPTNARLTGARRATFAIGWPHESKRAWVCKTEKMVEAGWHFAPTEECEDWVSCAYCKLSLDGWEPKDSPFDEHYRRNPDCPFFVFAGTTAPSKRPKAKKGRASKSARTSKASTRLSTQSNMSIMSESEAPSMTDIPDLDESIDTSTTSILSTMSNASTATNKGKRKAAGGKKTAKSKKAKTTRSTRTKKAEPEVEPEVVELDIEEEPVRQPMPEIETQDQDESIPVMVPSPTPVAEDQPQQGQPQPQKPSRQRNTKRPPVSPPKEPSRAPAEPLKEPSPASTPPAEQSKSPTPLPSPSTSDIENAPPSTRPTSERPPPPASLQSPSMIEEPIQWQPIDIELVFQSTPAESLLQNNADISEKERQMTVQEWIEHVAGRAEEDLKMEAERVVSVFEREGARAMGVLEGIECA